MSKLQEDKQQAMQIVGRSTEAGAECRQTSNDHLPYVNKLGVKILNGRLPGSNEISKNNEKN